MCLLNQLAIYPIWFDDVQVEVSPAYDHAGITATLAANLLYEMLCTLPGAALRND